jgi:hypothetical protein
MSEIRKRRLKNHTPSPANIFTILEAQVDVRHYFLRTHTALIKTIKVSVLMEFAFSCSQSMQTSKIALDNDKSYREKKALKND